MVTLKPLPIRVLQFVFTVGVKVGFSKNVVLLHHSNTKNINRNKVNLPADLMVEKM